MKNIIEFVDEWIPLTFAITCFLLYNNMIQMIMWRSVCKMKTLYFDCTNGISGDMVLKALMTLGNCEAEVCDKMANVDCGCGNGHGRSFEDVKDIIMNSEFSDRAKAYAKAIYQNIAEAEAEVHEETLETVHFHEVGRNQAIKNALGIGMAVEAISPDRITVSSINDGKGSVICSHGEISVPVPAVKAMMKKSMFTFNQIDVEGEMVTPSGLAALIGIGAAPEIIDITQKNILKFTEAFGTRDTGEGGLKAYIYES